MKLKYYVILFHVILVGIMLVLLGMLNQMEYHAVDMTQLNGRMKKVEVMLDQIGQETVDQPVIFTQEKILELEEKEECQILLLEDMNYMSKLYQAYSNGDTIFDYNWSGKLWGKIIFQRNDDTFQMMKNRLIAIVIVIVVTVLIIGDFLLLILYHRIYKPFTRLKRFASNIANGELEIPLEMRKHNYFGAFTESFDIMREELKAAKAGEASANRSKKELVASLSHDIKTPVSTIKALCEILEIKLSENEVVSKIHTIQQKADLIDQLISNMFHATLSELEALKILPQPEPSTELLAMIEDMNHYDKIHLQNEVPSCLVIYDPLRMTQVIDNIIGNSYKYAGTDIWISFWETESEVFAKIRDEGKELEDLDLALIFEKFYRGSNSEGKSGSGLGLYLAKLFMEGMQGSLTCEADHGFAVTLSLKKA